METVSTNMKTLKKPIPDRPHGWLAASLFLALCGPLWAADLDLELLGSWPLFPRGPAQAVAVSGSYAYVATSGGGLQVIDVSDPVHPRRVGSDGTGNIAYDVAVSGNFAYVAEGGWGDGTNWHRLQVIDISDPANPRRAGVCAIDREHGEQAFEVAGSGSYAYVAAGVLQVVDVSNPANPQRVGAVTSILDARAVALSGNYAYVAASSSGLHVFDLSDPAHPQRVGSYDTTGRAQGVAVSGNYAYVAETGYGFDPGGLRVIDISNPANPQQVGSHDTNDVSGVAVSGIYVYLAGTSGLQVIDISDPTKPTRVGATGGAPQGVAISGHYAYVADDGGLQVIDISDPTRPQQVAVHDTSSPASDVAVSEGRAFVADGCYGLQVLDVSDPATPRWLGGYDTGGQAKAVAVSGNFAYVADGYGGLQVIDISNPANPQQVGAVTNLWAIDVSVSGDYAYVADGPAGMQVIDVSDPANPQRLGGCWTEGYARGVVVSDHYAYVAVEDAELQVIDISNPAGPQRVCAVTNVWSARAVTVSGRYAYAAGYELDQWTPGLQVLDISNPANPLPVGGFRTKYAASDVAVWGHYAYVVSFRGTQCCGAHRCLEVIDVSDPANPQPVAAMSSLAGLPEAAAVAVSGDCAYWLTSDAARPALLQVFGINPANPQQVGAYQTSETAYRRVAASGNYAYLAPGPAGLQVIDVSNPANPHRVGGYAGFEIDDVALSGHYAYLVVPGGWLEVIDIANPANPQRVGGFYLVQGWEVYVSGVAVSGSYAYVAGCWREGTNEFYGLQVIDISSLANPQRVGEYKTGWWPDVAVSGNYAYVVCRTSLMWPWWETIDGLEIIDISDPTKPRRVSGCDIGGFATGVAVSENYAYIAGTLTGLQVIDISDPADPKHVGGNSSISGEDVAVAGDKVYVAAGEDGLIILNTYQPPPRIESVEFDGDVFHLIFRGEAGRTVRLQRSPDLKTWEDWVILTATGDSQAVADPSAESHPCQFYRAVGQ